MKNLKSSAFGLALSLAVVGAASTAFAAQHTCVPRDVGVFNNRIHVRCTTSRTDGASTIWWFAVPTSDSALANRFLNVANTALASGKSMYLDFTAGDTSGSAFGCLGADCRRVTSFGVNR